MKNELKEIDPFIADNFFYEKEMNSVYKIKCPNCKEFFNSFMSGESSNPIELFKFIKSSVKNKKANGQILIIDCPKCDNACAIDFKGKLNDADVQ